MLKQAVFTILFFAITAFTVFHANAQTPTAEESELATLIVKADTSFDMDQIETAEEYLLEAKKIIVRNPEIDVNLQGHFNKVSGKLYMKNSFAQALEYFNVAARNFDRNEAESAQIKMFTGIAYYYANDLRMAELYFQEAKGYFSLSRDNAGLAQVLNNLGIIAYEQGNEEAAAEHCRQALALNLALANTLNASRNQSNLDYFTNSEFHFGSKNAESKNERVDNGGGGGSGSGTTVNTGGGGTVVVGGNGGGGLTVYK
ncbi:MAG: tetratricopeptide repeat protein [Pyrinomonadaceae bacterium]|nr:tetratricopeptide repeat protein [Pyrinomonadaceae bacterium]